MEKKHISIIGSCVSRNMFNTTALSEVFEIDKYAFKTCTWDYFNNSLDLPESEFSSLPIPASLARMMHYDCNKVILKEIEKAHSEYLMVDFVNIYYDVDEIIYKNKKIYVQDMFDRFSKYEKEVRNNNILKNITRKRIKYEIFDKEIIISGLKKFAHWINNNFDPKKVIINIPFPTKYYIKIDDSFNTYNEGLFEKHKCDYMVVKEYSELFISLLNNPIVLNDIGGKIGANNMFDLNVDYPDPIHFSGFDYHRQSVKLLNLLDIEIPFQNNIDCFAMDYNKLNNKYCKQILINIDYKNKSNTFGNINLNNYFLKIENFHNIAMIK